MTNYYAPSPYDRPPSKVAAPESLKDTDMFPAVTLMATRAQVKKFGDVLEQEDEFGTCLLAHFEVFDTLIIFYQSALDEKNYWTVFVDMVSCLDKKQFPIELGNAVVRYLTRGTIQPDWQNDEADTEYLSRRRRLSSVVDVVNTLSIENVTVRVNLLRLARTKSPLNAYKDRRRAKIVTIKADRLVTAKKAAPARKFAVRITATRAKKTATTKRAAPAKKTAAAK